MIVLGIVLLILGAILDIGIFLTLGVILIVVALVLYIAAAVTAKRGGQALFGRRKHLF